MNKIFTKIFLALVAIFISHVSIAQKSNLGKLYIEKSGTESVWGSVDNSDELKNDGNLYLRANYTDSGITNFTGISFLGAYSLPSGFVGNTSFIGTAEQTIIGSDAAFSYGTTFKTSFYNATFNNANNFKISKQIAVHGKLTFTAGVINNVAINDIGYITFFHNATHEYAHDNKHINTYARKILKSTDTLSFSFPVGNGTYHRPAKITANTSGNDEVYLTRYYSSNPILITSNATDGSVQKISNYEYWTIERERGTSNAQVTLYWNTGTTSGTDIIPSDLSNLRIVRWDTEKSKWINQGNIKTTGTQTSGSITANVDGYGMFTFARGCDIDGTIEVNSASVCNNGTEPIITFTGSNGTEPYTFYYHINDVITALIVTSSSGSNTATVNVPTNVVGEFVYHLDSVIDNGGCKKIITNKQVTVNVKPLPTATVQSGDDICSGGTALFTITGTEGAVVTYKINSGADQVVTLTSGTATVSIANATTNQTLTLVKVSLSDCEQNLTGSATVNVSSPVTFSTTKSDITCFGNEDGWIEVTATGGTAPYIFKLYNENNVQIQTCENQYECRFASLKQGAYSIKVIDNKGCESP